MKKTTKHLITLTFLISFSTPTFAKTFRDGFGEKLASIRIQRSHHKGTQSSLFPLSCRRHFKSTEFIAHLKNNNSMDFSKILNKQGNCKPFQKNKVEELKKSSSCLEEKIYKAIKLKNKLSSKKSSNTQKLKGHRFSIEISKTYETQSQKMGRSIKKIYQQATSYVTGNTNTQNQQECLRDVHLIKETIFNNNNKIKRKSFKIQKSTSSKSSLGTQDEYEAAL